MASAHAHNDEEITTDSSFWIFNCVFIALISTFSAILNIGSPG